MVLFFWPFDFTFICPTEVTQFNDKLKEFEAANTQVIGCSCDSPFVHQRWTLLGRD